MTSLISIHCVMEELRKAVLEAHITIGGVAAKSTRKEYYRPSSHGEAKYAMAAPARIIG